MSATSVSRECPQRVAQPASSARCAGSDFSQCSQRVSSASGFSERLQRVCSGRGFSQRPQRGAQGVASANVLSECPQPASSASGFSQRHQRVSATSDSASVIRECPQQLSGKVFKSWKNLFEPWRLIKFFERIFGRFLRSREIDLFGKKRKSAKKVMLKPQFLQRFEQVFWVLWDGDPLPLPFKIFVQGTDF